MIEQIQRFIIPAAYSLLPDTMQSRASTAMLLAIGLQESKFQHRTQVGGPAHGFWQFELAGGVTGVLRHPATAEHAQRALRALQYPKVTTPSSVYALLPDHDVLAAVFARLLLWTVPGRLPTKEQAAAGWRQYIDGWRPGTPHPETWNAYFASAWHRVDDAARFAP